MVCSRPAIPVQSNWHVSKPSVWDRNMQRVSGRGASWHIPNCWLCCSTANRWPHRFPSEVREQMLTRLPRPPPVSLFLALGILAGLVSGKDGLRTFGVRSWIQACHNKGKGRLSKQQAGPSSVRANKVTVASPPCFPGPKPKSASALPRH
jgi:hypothetical protein